MGEQGFSDIDHYAGLDFWGPLGAVRASLLVDLMRLDAGARVLDVGCGKAEFLLGLAQRHGVGVTGVDHSEHALALARTSFGERAPGATAEFLQREAAELSFDADAFDAVVWNGGPFLGDTFTTTLKTLSTWVRPGGLILIGHGFWSQPPPQAYLDVTGISADEMTDHATNIACGLGLGLDILYCAVSNRDEWDHFEGMIQYNVERHARLNPDNPDPRGRLDQRRAWFKAQQRWGRDTMGYGFYLFYAT